MTGTDLVESILSSQILLLFTVTALGLSVFGLWYQQKSSSYPLPPGPKALPILGNMFDFPTQRPWLTYTEWSQRYGDVVYVEALSFKMVIVSSYTAAKDLLDKRSALYSDRTFDRMVMMKELMQCTWNFGVANYNDPIWRRDRKIFHRHTHINVVATYADQQFLNARNLTVKLLENHQDIRGMLRHSFGRMMARMVYGIEDDYGTEKYINAAGRAVRLLLSALNPTDYAVNSLPFLKYIPSWFPGARFHRIAKEAILAQEVMLNEPLKYTQAAIKAGTAGPSWAHQELDYIADTFAESQKKKEEIIKAPLAIAYMAGVDTVTTTLEFVIIAMLLYPDVQRKGQEELDRVVGRTRLPTVDDAEQLSYVRAIISEVLRWRPAAPIGVPHAVAENDFYNGFLIPRRSTITPNAWAMLHDPDTYLDPDTFNPDRFLTYSLNSSEYKFNSAILNPREMAFGFGRRICPGRHLAEQGLFANVAIWLATLDITPAKDEHGQSLLPDPNAITGTFLAEPKMFHCVMTSRGEWAENLLNAVSSE